MVKCQFCKGDGHEADVCPSRPTKRKSAEVCQICKEEGHGAAECTADVDDEEDDEGDLESMTACSVCNAEADESCTDVEDEDCVHREERKSLQRKHRKREKDSSPPALKRSKSTSKEAQKFKDAEDIVKMSAEACKDLEAEHVVGVPEVWSRWLQAQPMAERREKWKALGEQLTDFYTTGDAADSRVSKVDVTSAKRFQEVLMKVLDPIKGYSPKAAEYRLQLAVGALAEELRAFQVARDEGWTVARAAPGIEKKERLTTKARRTAVTKAKKAVEAKEKPTPHPVKRGRGGKKGGGRGPPGNQDQAKRGK